MKKALTKINEKEIYYYENNVKKIIDRKDKITYPKGLSGDISGLSGNISGISGNCEGVKGNLDDCEITDKERKKGIDISELVEE